MFNIVFFLLFISIVESEQNRVEFLTGNEVCYIFKLLKRILGYTKYVERGISRNVHRSRSISAFSESRLDLSARF
jgi:hypothetical protein